MYENCADRLSNNLRLNEITILSFLQFYCKITRNQLEIVVKATYGLHSNKYFEILNLTFWGASLVTRRFELHSNSRGADEIKGLPISIDFCNRKFLILYLHGSMRYVMNNGYISPKCCGKRYISADDDFFVVVVLSDHEY